MPTLAGPRHLSHAVVLGAVLAGCAAAPAPLPAQPLPPPAPSPSPVVVTAPVERPGTLAMWIHVEQPGRVAKLLAAVTDPPKPEASCATGDLKACLSLADLGHPVDLAEAPGTPDDLRASGFAVRSLSEFRAQVDHQFQVTQPGAGMLRLDPPAGAPAEGGSKPASLVCDVAGADGPEHRVVCGNDEGVARLGPWLRGAPRPAKTEGLVQAEIYPAPVIAAVDQHFARDSARNKELREVAHDFGGATLRLAAADSPDAPIQLDLDLHMQSARSRWTRVLLAPPAAAGGVPEAFTRLPRGATAAVYLPGGGPLVALLDQLDSFGALAALDPTRAKGVADDLRALLGRPAVCAYVVDLDEAQLALTRAHKAPEKDRKKTEEMVGAAFDGYVVCGLQATSTAVEQLARRITQLAPPTPGETNTVRPAAGLGLPKGSFILESVRRPAATPGKASKAPVVAHVDDSLVVPDGATTWVVSGGPPDVHVAGRFAKRLLERPRAAVNPPEMAPGTVASGYVTTLLGAFFWDLATHSLEGLQTSLATQSPGVLRLAIAGRPEGPGGTVSFHVDADSPTLSKLGPRLAMASLPLGLLLAVMMADDDGSSN